LSEGGSADYFDRVADAWDGMRSGFFGSAVRERALAAAALPAGALAADVGAGSGFLTEALLAAGVRVVAVDRSSSMLAALRERLGTPPGLETRRGDAEALPLEDASLDGVFANMYVHHVERPPDALAEMVRALRPGGRLAVTDLESHDFAWLREEHHDRWLGFDREAFAGWLCDAGLEDVRVEPIGEQCGARSCSGESASVSIFLATGTRAG
jgi:ubiquinone/menaquinone biosynthesis C-methylase UbiE